MRTFNTELQVLIPDLTGFACSFTRNEDAVGDLVQDCVASGGDQSQVLVTHAHAQHFYQR